jgi:hypothetical protein
MFTVEYNVKFNRGEGLMNVTRERYISDLSFTFLHWRLMEQLEREIIDISNIDDE